MTTDTVCASCDNAVTADTEFEQFTTGEVMLICASMGACLPDHECDKPSCVCSCPNKPSRPRLMERAPNTAYLVVLPMCDICDSMGITCTARYDGAMNSTGQWAYMCEKHWLERGGMLGVGRGQRLKVKAD